MRDLSNRLGRKNESRASPLAQGAGASVLERECPRGVSLRPVAASSMPRHAAPTRPHLPALRLVPARRPRARARQPTWPLRSLLRPRRLVRSLCSRGARPAPPNVNLVELVAGLALTHDALHPGESLYLRKALAAHGVEADHVKVWQTVGKLRRRHGLVMSGEPREPRYRVEDWKWEAKRVRQYRRTPLAWAGLARKSDGGPPATWPDHRARALHLWWRE